MVAAAVRVDVERAHLRVPREAWTLDGFRAWVCSREFESTRARATWTRGEVLIDMSPESLESHNKVKTALTADLWKLIRDRDLGELYSDRMLLTNERAGLSTEPDLCFATWETLERRRLVPTARVGRDDDFIELVGSPDLVVEIVSDSSESKDLRLLRAQYARARVSEYWIIDARSTHLVFQIWRLHRGTYRAAAPSDKPQPSSVLGARVALRRTRNRVGRFTYSLQTQSLR